MATIYTGALYYAMEVGQADVDAGGAHEALIGLGYALGPGCGLLAAGSIAAGLAPASSFESVVLVLVTIVVLAAVAFGIRRASAQAAQSSEVAPTNG
jgi:hypothetical protein